jgi:hypothetical protein
MAASQVDRDGRFLEAALVGMNALAFAAGDPLAALMVNEVFEPSRTERGGGGLDA